MGQENIDIEEDRKPSFLEQQVDQNESCVGKSFLTDKTLHIRHVYELLYHSIPNLLQAFAILYCSFNFMFFANKLKNPNIVASVGFGQTIYNGFAYAIIISLNQGQCTQQSQAFGAKNYNLVGVILQRAQIIDLIYYICVTPIFLNIEPILLSIGIETEVSHLSAIFVKVMHLDLFMIIFQDSLKNYMVAMKQFNAPMYIQNISYMIVPLLCYFFTQIIPLSIAAFPLSKFICDTISVVWSFYYILTHKSIFQDTWVPYFKDSWFPFDKHALHGLIDYLKVALPLGGIVYFEWLYFDIMTFMVGLLKNEYELAAHAAYCTIQFFYYVIALGLSYSVNSYLGNVVGAGLKKESRNLMKISLLTILCVAGSNYILSILLEGLFIEYFTSSKEVEYYFKKIYFIGTNIFLFFDNIQCIISAIMRSIGQQNYACYGFLIIYHGIGLPLTVFLTFVCKLGLMGVWYSLCIIAFFLDAVFLYKLSAMNWDQTVDSVVQRLKKDQQKLIEMKNLESSQENQQELLNHTEQKRNAL